jgi:phospholipase/carboxylesterase
MEFDAAHPVDRRSVLRSLALSAAGLAAGCKLGPTPEYVEPSNGRIDARPSTQTGFLAPGARPLLLQPGRDGRLYVPPGLTAGTPAPLILALHGATGSGQDMLNALSKYADQFGFVMLCPDSLDVTWDAIRGLYADDVRHVNSAMAYSFERCNIDPDRIGVVGFSDGASYSLGLGRLNGDLFHRAVAFSPGVLLQATDAFKPEVYITHGYRDGVLPMDTTSIPIVEELEARGYTVTFRKFDGGHWMPLAYVPEALQWVIGGDLMMPNDPRIVR